MVDLASAIVIASYSAGSVNLTGIDIEEEAVITMVASLAGVVREPDMVAWIGSDYYATANEGDMDGGSRGFSIFDKLGRVVYDSGNELEHLANHVVRDG